MHPAQQNAVDFVRRYALERKPEALELLAVVCSRSNVECVVVDSILENIQRTARIGMHFHPDRLDGTGHSIALSMLNSGRYKNQFETHVSNGHLAPTADGPRAKWENVLFGPSYSDVPLTLRPKYGALSLLGDPYGPAPRFGSCHLLLKPECLAHATFCYGDSAVNPVAKGTWDTLEDILSVLLKDSFENEQVLGRTQVRPPALMQHLQGDLSSVSPALSDSVAYRNLNHYIEAQVHADIHLAEHVESLVVDPSFRDTHTGDTLVEVSETYGITLRWHAGFQLHASQVPNDYRGGQMREVAQTIAENGQITAATIGRAAIQTNLHPKVWAPHDLPPSQLLKYLWHVLLRFGVPLE